MLEGEQQRILEGELKTMHGKGCPIPKEEKGRPPMQVGGSALQFFGGRAGLDTAEEAKGQGWHGS